jgi:hypothetical protein
MSIGVFQASEKENIVLREKLTNVRDELAIATKELTLLTENLKGSKIQLNESSGAPVNFYYTFLINHLQNK